MRKREAGAPEEISYWLVYESDGLWLIPVRTINVYLGRYSGYQKFTSIMRGRKLAWLSKNPRGPSGHTWPYDMGHWHVDDSIWGLLLLDGSETQNSSEGLLLLRTMWRNPMEVKHRKSLYFFVKFTKKLFPINGFSCEVSDILRIVVYVGVVWLWNFCDSAFMNS